MSFGIGYLLIAALCAIVIDGDRVEWHPAKTPSPAQVIRFQTLALAMLVALALGLRIILPGIIEDLSAVSFGQRHIDAASKVPNLRIPGSMPAK